MASEGPVIKIKLDATKAIRQLRLTVNEIAVGRLAEMLGVAPPVAADWLVAKVAAFRGISESDALSLIEDTDRAV
jgi:hypothetical protein